MIHTNELRLNNLMQDAKGRMCKVERLSLDTDEIRISAIKGAITSLPISPIHLTEEILLKCGFRWSESLTLYMMWESETICDNQDFKNEEDGDGELYSIHFYHDGEHLIVENSNEHGEYGNMRFGKIKYLHQLQNLYFALTRKELEITL